MPSRHQGSVLHRAVGAAVTGLLLAQAVLPAAALAAPGGPPKPTADTITTTEGAPVSGNVLANDTNLGEGTLSVVGQGALSSSIGTLTIAANGDYTFTPASDWFGTATTTYDVANDKHTKTGTITINVSNVEDEPTANDDTVTVDEDAPTDVTGQLLANDTDPDSDTLTVTSVSNETGGDADLTGTTVTFTAPADECGPGLGSFDYTISDGNGGTDSAHAVVDVTCVNDDPVAVSDNVDGTEDTDVTITASTLAANDTDLEDDDLTVTGVSSPQGGTVSLDGGTITFVPTADLCGDDAASFDYTVEDGNGGSDTGTVTIDLACVNELPVAVDDSLNGTEDTDVTATSDDLTANDTDVDGDSLVVSEVSGAAGGSVVLEGSTITFTPAADACDDPTTGFDYTVSDGNGGTDTGHVDVAIACENDNPVAVADNVDGTEDTDVTITASDLATNDTDVEDDSLTVTGVSNPDGGTVSLDGGTITFVPTADLCGDDSASFDYTVEDGNGGSATGTVTIDLDCTNDAPVANHDTASVQTNSLAADHNVLANDTDVDEGDVLTVQSADVDASQGTASVEGNKVRFTPATGFQGDAVITYTITDGTETDSATLTITVSGDVAGPVVTTPTVAFGSGRVDETAPLKISWSATDVPSGVAKYEVQVSVGGGAFQPVYTGTGTSITKLYPFKTSLVFRVRAQDTVGNWSGWVSSAARRIVAFQESNTHVAYSGTWTRVKSSKSSGTGYSYTTTKDKKARLTVSGYSVMYVAPKTPASGKVKVYVDGALLGTYDLKVASTRLGRTIAGASWSGWGRHTIRIVSSSNAKTGLDAFIVLK